MGTPIVNEQRNSAPLQNCAFVSTADMTKADPAGPMAFLMEASMLGVGVGFDTKGADKDFIIQNPEDTKTSEVYAIPDTREGWVESVRKLYNSFLIPGRPAVAFTYLNIRPAGAPIKTFGGTASGPDPLEKLHDNIRKLFADRAGEKLTSTDIADVGNMIGACVVAGNVRRSAELLIGSIEDEDFLNLKNYGHMEDDEWVDGPAARRGEWGWLSNNSVEAYVGQDLSAIQSGIALNGEPGVIWMDVSRKYGRLIDPPNNKDWRAVGYNPCAEQTLESYEMCTLVETFLNRHESVEDFKRT